MALTFTATFNSFTIVYTDEKKETYDTDLFVPRTRVATIASVSSLTEIRQFETLTEFDTAMNAVSQPGISFNPFTDYFPLPTDDG